MPACFAIDKALTEQINRTIQSPMCQKSFLRKAGLSLTSVKNCGHTFLMITDIRIIRDFLYCCKKRAAFGTFYHHNGLENA